MNNMQTILNIAVIILIIIIMTLVIIVTIMYIKGKSDTVETPKNNKKSNNKKGEKKQEGIGINSENKQSVFNFLEFDDIEDNMIKQDNGSRYLMVVECQGINYDLMSSVEKTAVEDGFVQFLNTLRYKIQIYIQTRKVNLEENINKYEEKVNDVEVELKKAEMDYDVMLNSGRYSQEELDAELYELTKKRNLYEYGRDIINNTENMSLNKKILTKKYYIIIPYYVSELGENNFDKEEIKNIAFSELYTRAQGIIRMLSACDIKSYVLDTKEIIELLYVAYNRDDSEVYGIDKYIEAGYQSMYSTAPDVLEKRIRALDEKIQIKAMEKVTQKISEIELEKRREIRKKQTLMEDSIDELALLILEENKEVIGEDLANSASDKINKERESKKKGEEKDVIQKKKTRKRKSIGERKE